MDRRLLRHALIKSSFVPDRGRRQLRELTRYRTSLVHQRVLGHVAVHGDRGALDGPNVGRGDPDRPGVELVDRWGVSDGV